jgi:hypothetical protein
MTRRRAVVYAMLAGMAVALVMALFGVQVCRDWAFVCENTGSHKGYRQWCFGAKTGHWHRKSPLDAFVEVQEPEALVHRWTSYSGTGKNAFGRPILFGHGRPGAILKLNHSIQREWIAKNDAMTVRALYDLLVSDDEAAIEQRVAAIWDEILEDVRAESGGTVEK